jgi:hypothetical protein
MENILRFSMICWILCGGSKIKIKSVPVSLLILIRLTIFADLVEKLGSDLDLEQLALEKLNS